MDPPAILVLISITLVKSSSTLLSNHPPHSCCTPLDALPYNGVILLCLLCPVPGCGVLADVLMMGLGMLLSTCMGSDLLLMRLGGLYYLLTTRLTG